MTDTIHQVSDNLCVVGSHIDLAAAEMELAGVVGREVILRDKLDELFNRPNSAAHNFDYLLIDCPPSLGILTLNALAAVDEVLLPLQPHFLALHGLSKLLQTIELVSRRLNPQLKLAGVVLCQYESATRLAAEVAQNIEEFFGGERAKNRPGRRPESSNPESAAISAWRKPPASANRSSSTPPTCNGAEDYRLLAEELLHLEAKQRRAKGRVN